jgi:ATP-dependent DNA ligase
MLRPPIEPMLAVTVDALPDPAACPGGYAYEPKWDGFRAILLRQNSGVYLQSRTGKPLAPYFPDITSLAEEALPAGTVLDGELIVWRPDRAQTSFSLLQRRITAGTRVREFADQYPAHYVAFDLLQDADGRQLLSLPLAQRRTVLAALLVGTPAALVLCPQTLSLSQAREWMTDLPDAGIEGVVAKRLASRYEPGRRGWAKYKAINSTEAIIGGVTGAISHPHTVLLGRLDRHGFFATRVTVTHSRRPNAANSRHTCGRHIRTAMTRWNVCGRNRYPPAGPGGGTTPHPWTTCRSSPPPSPRSRWIPHATGTDGATGSTTFAYAPTCRSMTCRS